MTQPNSQNTQGESSPYFGMRALLLTRVSTPAQIKMYGHSYQEKEIRKKLIEPLGLQLDEEKHIIHDTYSGLEYRYREALDIILAMAERGEFDVLCMDVLDRGLGRKALARELFRLQLRQLGVRILTTDPHDHADDDSLEGQMMRLLRGYKSEEEINDFVRRTMGGKRTKAEGDETKGRPPRIIGQGHRRYGYKFIRDDRGKVIGVELNEDVILVDSEGTKWTEVKVVIFIFESAANGVPYKEIARILNTKGIPSLYATLGIKMKTATGTPFWQAAVISRMIWNSLYYGEDREFKTKMLEKVPGKKYPPRQQTSEEDQIIVPVPAIVSKELALEAQERAKRNKALASRNNSNSQESLLRCGLAKCGYCGGNMVHTRDRRHSGYATYNCNRHKIYYKRCETGCFIPANQLHGAAWVKAIQLIQDPKEVDEMVAKYKTADPTAKRRETINKTLADIRAEQKNVENNLKSLAKQGILDAKVAVVLTGQLKDLEKQEQYWEEELRKDVDIHAKWEKLQKRLNEFHERCAKWREKLNDPQFIPPDDFKREAFDFFGITAICYRSDIKPRVKIQVRPPTIVSLLSRPE